MRLTDYSTVRPPLAFEGLLPKKSNTKAILLSIRSCIPL